MQGQDTVDPAQIALDLSTRLAPKGEAPSRTLIDATVTEDIEQVNAFGAYSQGREAVWATAQKTISATKTVGLTSEVVSASLITPNVILAHMLSTAEGGPSGPPVRFRFMMVIVNHGNTWRIRSMATTLMQQPPG